MFENGAPAVKVKVKVILAGMRSNEKLDLNLHIQCHLKVNFSTSTPSIIFDLIRFNATSLYSFSRVYFMPWREIDV